METLARIFLSEWNNAINKKKYLENNKVFGN